MVSRLLHGDAKSARAPGLSILPGRTSPSGSAPSALLGRPLRRPAFPMVRLNFSRRYSMAHRLLHDASSKCLTPHGHDEVVTIGLRPLTAMALGGANMTASFAQAKGAWHAWIDGWVDHALQLNAED